MLLGTNLKMFLFFCIYFGMLFITLYNFNTSSNSYNKRNENLSNMQEFHDIEIFNNQIPIDDKLSYMNYEDDNFYNVNDLGFKHNIDCSTNPSILIAPYCYKMGPVYSNFEFFNAEKKIMDLLYKFLPERKFVDSKYRTKFKANIEKRIIENIKIVFDVLITGNEKYKNNRYFDNAIYDEFKKAFEARFALNIYLVNRFHYNHCSDIFYDLLLPLLKIQECIRNFNDKNSVCKFFYETITCCEPYIMHDWNPEEYRERIRHFSKIEEMIKGKNGVKKSELKKIIYNIGFYIGAFLKDWEEYNNWEKMARLYNMTILPKGKKS